MTTTTNLGLSLISDSAEDKSMLFSTWRAKIAGTGDSSNMNIIDDAFGQVQERLEELGDLGITEDTNGLIIRL